ncbi:MAG: butyrate kinase [Bacteroides sp.]
MKVLVINPGSTSTKIAIYEDDEMMFVKSIQHTVEELAPFKHINEQYEFRKNHILQELQQSAIPLNFDAVIARGGLLHPTPSGVYPINEKMKADLWNATMLHVCNLGAQLAWDIASLIPSCRSFIADPEVVDEFDDVARLSGNPLLPRFSIFHALNHKAISRKYAKSIHRNYEDLNLIVAHLGGGISVGAHRKGKVIDVNNALNGEGPISPERAGTLPADQLVELCFSGKYTKEELKKLLNGKGGLIAHLGTGYVPAITQAAEQGDERSILVLDAMIYTVAKEIGAMYVTLLGQVDAILLTGGIAHSEYCMSRLQKRIDYLAPVVLLPGEDEMGSLAFNAIGALKGELMCREYLG